MRKFLLIIVVFTLLVSCTKKEKIIMGLIKPSLNHLPVDYALTHGIIRQDDIEIVYFNSGWETNEALAAGKVDMAILPFTYIWSDQANGMDVRIISFLERESDGIIKRSDLESLCSPETKIGVLKGSTLEIIADLYFEKSCETGLNPEFVFFRTPFEMAAALKSCEVDALSYYVPSIFNLGEDYIIHDWYSIDFRNHPCCDLAVNGDSYTHKAKMIDNLTAGISKAVVAMSMDNNILEFISSTFNLTPEQAKLSFEHTGYQTGLDSESILFEQKAAGVMYRKGYINKIADTNEVYLFGNK